MKIQKINNQPSFQSLRIDEDILKAANPADVSRFRKEIGPFIDLLDQAAEGSDTLVQPILRNGRIKRVEVGSYYTNSTSMKDDLRTLALVLTDTFKPEKYIGYTKKLNFETFTGEKLLETIKATAKGAVKRFGRKK